jgi:hypothetical protein
MLLDIYWNILTMHGSMRVKFIDTVLGSCITGVVCCSKAPDVNRYTVQFENYRAEELRNICR